MIKYFKYLRYIIIHKWYVFIECCKLGIPIRGIIHDMSKLRPSEFFAYANYFYSPSDIPVEQGIKIQHKLDLAWMFHQHRNPHHWQFWLLKEDDGILKPQPMPEVFILEMVADWKGAGRAITGADNTASWYKENRDKQLMHPDTRKRVEELLGIKEE